MFVKSWGCGARNPIHTNEAVDCEWIWIWDAKSTYQLNVQLLLNTQCFTQWFDVSCQFVNAQISIGLDLGQINFSSHVKTRSQWVIQTDSGLFLFALLLFRSHIGLSEFLIPSVPCTTVV